MCVMGIWRVTVLLISLSYQGKSEIIRCYCNLDECVANNSTCSSENGGCFSNFLDYRDIKQVEHGCLHLLKKERQEECGNAPRSPSWSPNFLLVCCKSDMCNQVLGPDSDLTQSIVGTLINSTDGQKNFVGGFERSGAYDHRQTNEIWFKAVTIVVPICGAMILFLLIALAFKILRADHVTVDKYCGKGFKSNANYADSHVISFKTAELNSEDFSKKMPLLYETRQTENFRSFTSARIHFGQNVNILREAEDSNKVEKNLENEKINLEKPWFRPQQRDTAATTSRNNSDDTNNNSHNNNVMSSNHSTHNNNNNNSSSSNNNNCLGAAADNSANSTLDVRVVVSPETLSDLPVLSLNLDKTENLSSCNIYTNSPRANYGGGPPSCSANVQEKVYEKYLL